MSEKKEFTNDDLLHLKATLSRGIENRTDPIWIRAFLFYANATKEHFRLNCRPYAKVGSYIFSDTESLGSE